MFGKWSGLTRARAGTSVAALAIAITAMLVAFGLGTTGASAQQAKQFAINSIVATTTGVNLREQPAAGSASILAMPVNARALVIGGPFNDSWFWLEYNGVKGYANGQYLVLVDENYTPVPSETPTSANTTAPIATSTAVPAAPTGTTVIVSTTTVVLPTGTPIPAAPTAAPGVDSSGVPTTEGVFTNLWLAEMAYAGNVRSGPGIENKIVKGWWVGRRVLLYQVALDKKGAAWYRVSTPPEEPQWVHSSLIRKVAPVLYEPARYKGRWVNVNISQQVVTAYENGKPVLVTLASTGKGKNATDLGVYKIYWRLPKQDMKGGNKAAGDYYSLKDVPFPQYFNTTGESLHGTYWHDDFGHVHSHGCVNLSIPISEWFYGWASIGTTVYVHN